MKLSPDRRRWADVQELEAVSELFGTQRRGAFRFGFKASKTEDFFVDIATPKPAPQ